MAGPWRPANISTQGGLLHVINQLARETNFRIDNLQKQVPIHRILKTSATMNFGSIAAGSAQQRDVNLVGAPITGTAHVSPRLSLGNPNLIWSAAITASNKITVSLVNPTGGPITPATVDWNISVII